MKKINEICLSGTSGEADEDNNEGDTNTTGNVTNDIKGSLYINVNELELNLATKTRSSSLDHHNIKRN